MTPLRNRLRVYLVEEWVALPTIKKDYRMHGNGCLPVFRHIKTRYGKIFRRCLYVSYCFKVITVWNVSVSSL